MFFIIILICSALIAISVSHYQIRYRRRNFLLSKIPTMPTYPLVGSGLSFFGKSSEVILNKLMFYYEKLGPIYKFDLSPYETTVVVSDPKIAEAFLSNQKLIEKSSDYKFIKKWLGDGLLLSSDSKWHQRKKIITPAFHFKILENFFSIMEKNAKIFVSEMTKNGGRHIDVHPKVSNYALDVICESAMGCTINAQTDEDSEYVRAVQDITNILFTRIFDVFKRFDIVYENSKLYQNELKALKILHGFTNSVIKKRREELENMANLNENIEEKDEFGIKRKMAFLDFLLSSTIDGQPLSDEDIKEEVDTFMTAGHDTTASALTFCLYNLALYHDVQRKAYEECKVILGEDFSEPRTMQKINELNYLELVIKETLRLYPSVPFFGRKVHEEVDVGGLVIPENVSVYFAPILMGRNPSKFKDPLKFDPMRFSDDFDLKAENPYALLPFSAGPRNCIGQKFAMLEMKSFLSKVLQYFEISIAKENENLILISNLVLRSKDGIKLCMKRRE